MTKNNRTMHRILLSGDMIPPPHLNYMINNRSVCIVPMLRMGPWGGGYSQSRQRDCVTLVLAISYNLIT